MACIAASENGAYFDIEVKSQGGAIFETSLFTNDRALSKVDSTQSQRIGCLFQPIGMQRKTSGKFEVLESTTLADIGGRPHIRVLLGLRAGSPTSLLDKLVTNMTEYNESTEPESTHKV